ncbi:MAG: hypothetical protein AB7F43_10275 [Bacteriovoracia bacterium]
MSVLSVKIFFEKPIFVWLVAISILASIFFVKFQMVEPDSNEVQYLEQMKLFSESSFPPKIDLLRTQIAEGHPGFSTLFGRIYSLSGGKVKSIRAVSFGVTALAFFFFVLLGMQFVYHNRVNPLWVSTALLLFLLNPYSIEAFFKVGWTGTFLLFSLAAFYFFKKDLIPLASLLLAMATLINWVAILLALSLIATRFVENESRILRPERILILILPLFVASLPAFDAAVRDRLLETWSSRKVFRFELFFYSLSALPIYTLYFSWMWGLRARLRAQMLGLGASVVAIPFYFLNQVGNSEDLGLLHFGVRQISETYSNLILFIPWIVGMFLFVQLILLNIRSRSRPLRYFLVLFFLVQPLVELAGDRVILLAVPFVLLFSLSEALVGEEGKLS